MIPYCKRFGVRLYRRIRRTFDGAGFLKILFVCHRFPYPPARGGKIRPFNIIRHLSERHEVTVASIARSQAEADEGEGLADHCHKFLVEVISSPWDTLRMVSRLPSATPSSMGYFYSPALTRRIRAELAENQYDFIFVHCSSVAQYVENVPNIPKMLDFGDMDSQKWLIYAKAKKFPLSMGYLIEGLKLKAREKLLAEKFDYCTCTTASEYQTLVDYGITTPSDWFPNGVDLGKFSPSEEPYDPDLISFIGRMDYYPNQVAMLDFCAHTLPLLRAERPGVKLSIIGAEPSLEIRNLGELEGVTVTGTVPDVQPLVLKSAVNIAPLSIARGTQNKILESMAMGVPVVSSEVASHGIDAEPEQDFLVGDSPESYTRQVLRLMNDPDERRRYSEAGRKRVETHHSWAASMRRFDRIFADCMARQINRAA